MQGPPRTKQENKIATRNPIFCSGVLCNRGALKCVRCLVMRDPSSFDLHMSLILISRILEESRLFFPSRAAVFIYKRLACHEDERLADARSEFSAGRAAMLFQFNRNIFLL